MIPSNQELTDQQLIERWRGQPAPFLSLLHAFHDRDGYLSESALRAIAKGLRQRAKALNAFLQDIYHDQEILRAGRVPKDRVTENKQFRPEMVGIDVPGGI